MSSMRPSFSVSANDTDLEAAADALLTTEHRDPDAPCYTDRQLRRRSHTVDGLGELIDICSGAAQGAYDELVFLIQAAHMRTEDRLCLGLWVDGWTQAEIAAAMGVSQQRVSRWFRSGLAACIETAPPSFREFSRRFVYRAPRGCWAQPGPSPRPKRVKPAKPETVCAKAA